MKRCPICDGPLDGDDWCDECEAYTAEDDELTPFDKIRAIQRGFDPS